MKFLCDNCKAKYQIADEKVAGKTVRMKCRKCGHQIEVRSAVTEGSGSMPPPAPLPGVKAPPKPGLATSLSAQKPKAPAGSALAGAFTKNVEDAPVSSVSARGEGSLDLSVSDEWYVAINGVPVGPIRISELRRKAATGAVTEESLCWQEGLEEWRPIRTIPDLATIVREAAAGNRPSLASTEAAAPARISNLPPAPRRPSTIPPSPVQPSAPRQLAAPPAPAPLRSNVVPLRPAAPSMEDVPLAPFGSAAPSLSPFPGSAPMPVAPPAAATAPLPLSSPAMPVATPQTSPLAPPIAVPDPFAVPAPVFPSSQMPAASPYSLSPLAPATSHAPSYPDRASFHPPAYNAPAPAPIAPPSTMPVEQKRGGAPLWFWPILVLFLGFGGGGAYFLFGRPQPPPAPVVIQMPATAPPDPAPAPSDSVATIEMPDTPTVEPKDGTTKKPATKKEPVAAAAPKPTEEKKGLDLGGLGTGPSGPAIGPGGSSGGGSSGGLDTAGVERVVAGHRAGVKRTCWERGGSDQKSSVNVTVTANVAPNGQVSSVSSSGDDPVVGKCIENQVKGWTFPAPGSPTTINIPFKFVRQ
ncbi:MAG: zinc-ribbon domain-containing protein [Labilithrix sp.]|nr:zinc-ribbon domain-containing protein [Labilithrix sp.]MCW5816067.1 zinc-ribbon domain-containing protein [Labilithrix sp.]